MPFKIILKKYYSLIPFKMSLTVGLGASQADLDVQGEIDFDFFDESDDTNNSNASSSKSNDVSTAIESKEHGSKFASQNLDKYSKIEESDATEHDLNSLNLPESCSSRNYKKPTITVSCDDATGVVQKTTIETVIPTPFTYKDNKCGKLISSVRKTLNSPRLKNKAFKDDHEISDDSSISSMSDSESLSTESEDSFEFDKSDSMTDVSPIASPYNCYTPSPLAVDQSGKPNKMSTSNEVKDVKKEGVKFDDAVVEKQCGKCETINFHELVSAMNRLQMKQNASSISTCSRKCISPVLTQNAKCRKNLSFSNEEVRKIDNDNQNLLKKIVAQQNRAKTPNISTVHVRSSSAVNRQRHQRQIELENLALLKRLETTKPSKNLSRSHLLRDFERRSAGVLSRASSRSSYPNSSQMSHRTSALPSGRSSAVSVKSSNTTCLSPMIRSHSSSATDKM